MGRGLGSNTMSPVMARLLLLSICIGILAKAASAQVNPPNALASKLGGYCGKSTMSCSMKCGYLGCLAGCVTSPSIGCGTKCFFENTSCQSGCTLFDIRGQSARVRDRGTGTTAVAEYLHRGSRDRGGGDNPKCVGLGTAGQLPGQS
ncbi:hypothetical protein Gohar_022707 [Gossypium harknessii]|uniref:Uncharacterized protein n=1 Tax=Gossypium harknessii TaxID=34285 RepID=A0A7J9HAJ4_9ROSI|nr:hypothetical protein [Gossypium harknessii]